MRGTVRAGADPLPADNTFHFVLTPSAPVSRASIVDNGDRRRREPVPREGARHRHDAAVPGRTSSTASRVDAGGVRQARRRRPERHRRFRRRRAAARCKRFVERGGGLLVVAGDRTHVAAGRSAICCPARSARRRSHRRAAAARSATSTTAIRCSRCSRRRAAATSRPRTSSATARCSPRRPIACSRASTMARWRRRRRRSAPAASIVWTSTLDDSWTDIGVKPVFLPLVHQLVALPRAVRAADVVVHRRPGARPRPRVPKIARRPRRRHAVGRTRSRSRARGEGNEGLLELTEQGIYEMRAPAHHDRTARGDRREPRSGRVRSDAARPARARRRGHRPRDADARPDPSSRRK